MGNGAVGVRHETVIDVDDVVTVAPPIMFGTVEVVGHAGATIDVIDEAPEPSDVNGVIRNEYTDPGSKPVTTVVNSGTPAELLPRFGEIVVQVAPLLSLCSSMYP